MLLGLETTPFHLLLAYGLAARLPEDGPADPFKTFAERFYVCASGCWPTIRGPVREAVPRPRIKEDPFAPDDVRKKQRSREDVKRGFGAVWDARVCVQLDHRLRGLPAVIPVADLRRIQSGVATSEHDHRRPVLSPCARMPSNVDTSTMEPRIGCRCPDDQGHNCHEDGYKGGSTPLHEAIIACPERAVNL